MRDLYHGILQVGVGFHHWRNGNFHGATTLLDEGLAKLALFAPGCQGVDIASLLSDASAARARLGDLGPARMSEYDLGRAPRIRLIS